MSLLSHPLSPRLTGVPANESEQASDRIVGAPYRSACQTTLCTRSQGGRQGARPEKEIAAVSTHSLESRVESHRTGITRKLEDVHRDLAPLEEQGDVEGFFNNVKNAEKLGSLIEDIRDAMLEYQVRIHILPIASTSDARTRLRYSKISMTRVVDSSWVSPPFLSSLRANRWVGISGPYHSQRNPSRRRGQLPRREQARVPERNKERRPQGD